METATSSETNDATEKILCNQTIFKNNLTENIVEYEQSLIVAQQFELFQKTFDFVISDVTP